MTLPDTYYEPPDEPAYQNEPNECDHPRRGLRQIGPDEFDCWLCGEVQ